MGAGASTEFNAEAVLADEGDPTEPVADEGYDSDLAGDIREGVGQRTADQAKVIFLRGISFLRSHHSTTTGLERSTRY